MDNSTNNMSEKLVQYLDGELSGREKDDLEKQLVTDKDLPGQLESGCDRLRMPLPRCLF